MQFDNQICGLILATDLIELHFSVKKCLLFIILIPFLSHAQTKDTYFGFSAGLSFDFGTKVNRIGLSAAAYYVYSFTQINSSVKLLYNFQSLGLKAKTPEIQLGGGINFGYGKRDSVRTKFTGLAENNTTYNYAAGYSYLRYWDKNKTSQSTGIFNFQMDKVRIITENDLFGAGKGWRDHFRTGALLVDYTYNDFRFAINSTLWTGDFIGCDIVKDSLYPSRFGYRKEERSQFGNFSLGLLSAQINWLVPGIPFNQNARLNMGVDSEKVRHIIQNKFIHDQPYLPKKWIKHENPHLPMISSDGSHYLFQPDQVIRPASFYFNIGLNSGIFY